MDIYLNEQQVDYLKMLLDYEIQDDDTSHTYRTIALQVIKLLEQK